MAYIQARQKIHSFAEWNDPVGGSSNIRKEQCSFGWDWGPRFASCGIFKNIELQAWDTNRISHVRVQQQHSAGGVRLTVALQLAHPAADTRVRCRLALGGQIVAQGEGIGA